MDEAKTRPKPIAKGPPMFKNFSEGAVAAIALKPPTAPAVYQAALTSNGPPKVIYNKCLDSFKFNKVSKVKSVTYLKLSLVPEKLLLGLSAKPKQDALSSLFQIRKGSIELIF